MKIAILGAGALGCVFGAALTEAGHETWLVNRSPEHVRALRRRGLRVDDATGTRVIAVRATTSAAEAGVADLVIVLVKTFQTQSAIRGADALLGVDTLVLSLQNGLGAEELLAGAVGRDRVLAGRTYVGGVLLGPGHIRSAVPGKATFVGALDGDGRAAGSAAGTVAEAFTAAGLATTASADITAVIWDKLLVNVATGALAAVTGLGYGALYDEPLLAATAIDAVAEAIAVARAAGVRPTITDPARAWELAAEGLPADFRTSMLQSLDKASVTEIDAVNGAVVREGRRTGVPTPVNATLVACVKGIERAMTDRARTEIPAA